MKDQATVIAMDGPAGSGKSTTAREVARRLGWQYVDTGAMYRALALAVLRAEGDPEQASEVLARFDEVDIHFGPSQQGEVPPILLDGEDVSGLIRSSAASDGASKVSFHPPVRRRMVALQRELGLRRPSVLEGRDIGTVVFPDAGLKVYLDASVEERARRRLGDYTGSGELMDLEQVKEDIRARDYRDSHREEGALTRAPDAEVIETTGMSIEEQVQAVIVLAHDRFGEEMLP